MKAKGIPVIARYYQTKKREEPTIGVDEKGRIGILFFPNDLANFGNIGSWQWFGEHSEASIEFYRECKPMEKEEAEKLIKRYWDLYPHEEGEFYTIKQKINYDQLRKAWKGGN
jgi:hypothetical protein